MLSSSIQSLSDSQTQASSAAQALATGEALHSVKFDTTVDSSGATRADVSSLDVDAESAKLAANALEHQAAVQVAHARIGILKAAMGVGG
jgi:flagellar basal-body rod protein FlgB